MSVLANPKPAGRRWHYLLTGVIVMLFAGIIYAWSVLKVPFLTEFQWSQSALGLNYTIMMWCFCLGGILGGILMKKLPVNIIILLAALMAGGGFLLASRIQPDMLWLLYISYGGLCGLGIGVVYNAVISTVMGWFPDLRATASGVMMMGFGASSLVLGSVAGQMLNQISWRVVFALLGLAIFVIFVVGAILIRRPAMETAPAASGKAAAASAANEKATASEKSVVSGAGGDYSTGQMLRRSSFWKFYIVSVLLCSIGSCVISMAKDISLVTGFSEGSAIMLVGLLSISNGIGRIFCGVLFDRIGWEKTLLTACIIAILAAAFVLLSVFFSIAPLLVVGLIVTGVSYGFMPVISSGYVSAAYGRAHFAQNFSIANTMLLFASISATVGGAIVSGTNNYAIVFAMLLGFSLLGFVISRTLKKI